MHRHPSSQCHRGPPYGPCPGQYLAGYSNPLEADDGFEALWVPGTDHAGISTQTVVERHLIGHKGKRRKDFSREEFLSMSGNGKSKRNAHSRSTEKLGCSCDWSRLRFTMDEGNNRAVRTMFKKLYDAGLIYRGDYLVNWDPVTQTAWLMMKWNMKSEIFPVAFQISI